MKRLPPPPPRDRRRRGRASMAERIALLTTAVAAVAVLIAGAVSYGLVQDAAESEARRHLRGFADMAAEGAGSGPVLSRRFTVELRRQGIEVVQQRPGGRIRPEGADAAGIVTPFLANATAGASVSTVTTVDGDTYLVEARPLAGGGAVALVQQREASRALGRRLVGRTMIALVIGLAVAALAGWLLARRFSQALRRTARAAHALAGGQRQIRVPEEGAAEVADVAASLNALASALETSEGRQRAFLLSISHELRTPLTAVKGFAESLADGVTTGPDVRAVGATMLAESDRLERLVSDLLDLARLGAQDFRIDPADVDLGGLVAAAAGVWRARCEALGVRFTVELPDGPTMVRTDAVRTRQILDGLAENALRVTPADRPIVFAVRAIPGGGVLEVRDGGPGLTEEDCAVAFERSVLYERYRGVRRVGTGVGLALVHGLATRLGGHAVAGHAPEGGACFAVWLPAAAPEPAATASDGVDPPSGGPASHDRVTAELPPTPPAG